MFENRRISQGPVDDYDAVIQIDFSEPWVVLVYHGQRNNNSEVLQSQCAPRLSQNSDLWTGLGNHSDCTIIQGFRTHYFHILRKCLGSENAGSVVSNKKPQNGERLTVGDNTKNMNVMSSGTPVNRCSSQCLSPQISPSPLTDIIQTLLTSFMNHIIWACICYLRQSPIHSI